MSDLRRSSHFVRRGALPEIESSTSLQQAYARLAHAGRSAFFLKEGGRVTAYVRAHDLAVELFPPGSTGDVPARARLTARPIGEVLREHPRFTLPIEPGAVTPDASLAPLQDRPDAVFVVVSEERPTRFSYGVDGLESTTRGRGATVEGFLLNHETLMATSTRKTLWRCTNPYDKHDNPDPDHGTCYRCPFPTHAVDG